MKLLFLVNIYINKPVLTEKGLMIMDDKHRILSTVGLHHAFNDGSVVVIPLLFPIFKMLFNLSYTQVGVITGGGLLVTLIANILIGRISDRKNFRTLLSIGIILLS